MIKLYIGNKNYSSWSMRPWVLLKQAGIDFEEVMVRFDSFDSQSQFKTTLSKLSPTGKVPLLVDGDLAVWDTLAIAEYVAEEFPNLQLWPADKAARARARSVCAEMHSGFTGLRSNCPMNIEATLLETGALIWRDKSAVRADVARLSAMWEELLAQYRRPHVVRPVLRGGCILRARLRPPQNLWPAGQPGGGRLCVPRAGPARRAGLDHRRAGRERLSGL